MRDYPDELRRDLNTVVRLDTTHLLLAFKEPHTLDDISLPLQHLGLAFEEGDREKASSFSNRAINHTDRRFWVRTLHNKTVNEELYNSIEQTFGEWLDWIGPVYQMPDTSGLAGLFCPLPDVLLIKAKQGDSADILHMSSAFNLREDLKKSISLSLIGYRYFVIENPKANSSYKCQRQLLESGSKSIEEVLHENMPMLVPFSMIPVDERYKFQWNMVRIQAGEDTLNPGTVTGWDLQTGSRDIIIAILDSGCDLTHPDLLFSDNGINGELFGNGDHLPSAAGFESGHGTLCAGVAAATINNIKGVAGVAGGCLIWPFAFVNSTDIEVTYGIAFALSRGNARVINMSFNSTIWNQRIINPYIERAYNRNVIMCASTGNDNGPLTYPATNPHVIACGASDLNDNRARRSNFGQGISVVAPGVNIVTTRPSGGRPGSDPSVYETSFRGTSAAAPHVSGLAALILSEDPTLSSDDVRKIIERTADKVGTDPYVPDPFTPYNSWNRFMGYGRINVLRALQAVRARQERQSDKESNYSPVTVAQERTETNPILHLARLNRGLIEHEAALDRLEKERLRLDTKTTIHRTLLSLGRDASILNLINEMYENPGLIEELRKDSESILEARGVALPEEVSISVVDNPGRAVRVKFSINNIKILAQWSPELGFSTTVDTEGE